MNNQILSEDDSDITTAKWDPSNHDDPRWNRGSGWEDLADTPTGSHSLTLQPVVFSIAELRGLVRQLDDFGLKLWRITGHEERDVQWCVSLSYRDFAALQADDKLLSEASDLLRSRLGADPTVEFSRMDIRQILARVEEAHDNITTLYDDPKVHADLSWLEHLTFQEALPILESVETTLRNSLRGTARASDQSLARGRR